jgi:hypothetical protein
VNERLGPRPERRLLIAVIGAALGLSGTAPAAEPQGPAAAPPASGAEADWSLAFLLGGWDIVATTPGSGESARFSYDVSPLLGTWISGRARSDPPGEESKDVWGKDSASGELIRIIFAGGGTYAVVRSPGWQGGKLVLEGDARSPNGVVRVRETIERESDDRFLATWEAYRNGSWSAYSVERVTRRAAPGSRPAA